MRLCFSIGFCFSALASISIVFGQHERYTPGQKIEYKVSDSPEVWEQGVFVRSGYENKQPIIRRKPTQFFPEGAEIAWQWDRIRPFSPKAITPGTQPNKPANPPAGAGAKPSAGKGLMSKSDVLAFLKVRLGADPLNNPKRDEIKLELAAEIKRRGLAFRFEVLDNAFRTDLSKLINVSSEVTFPLAANYGPPTPESWLTGSWNLHKIGATVDYVRDGKVYRQGEIGVANVGKLVLSASKSYTWTPSGGKSITGKWRAATTAEMKHQGGAGIVLLKAKSGWDWIVQQDRETTLPGAHIWISELNSRQVREAGVKR